MAHVHIGYAVGTEVGKHRRKDSLTLPLQAFGCTQASGIRSCGNNHLLVSLFGYQDDEALLKDDLAAPNNLCNSRRLGYNC